MTRKQIRNSDDTDYTKKSLKLIIASYLTNIWITKLSNDESSEN